MIVLFPENLKFLFTWFIYLHTSTGTQLAIIELQVALSQTPDEGRGLRKSEVLFEISIV
jgi:hypothetical protein